MKHSDTKSKKLPYEDIYLPKNSPLGLYVAGCSFILGFGFVWHILWLLPIGALGIITCLITRALEEDTEYRVPAAEIKAYEHKYRAV